MIKKIENPHFESSPKRSRLYREKVLCKQKKDRKRQKWMKTGKVRPLKIAKDKELFNHIESKIADDNLST